MYSNNYVYFMRNEVSGRIKIGQSIDPERRRREVAIREKCPIKLLRVIPAPSLEKMLHEYLSEDRISGEWFEPSDFLLTLIQTDNVIAAVMYPQLVEEARRDFRVQQLEYIRDTAKRLLTPYRRVEYYEYPISRVTRWNNYYKLAIKLVDTAVHIDHFINSLWPF